jgi:hypothetical protein
VTAVRSVAALLLTFEEGMLEQGEKRKGQSGSMSPMSPRRPVERSNEGAADLPPSVARDDRTH